MGYKGRTKVKHKQWKKRRKRRKKLEKKGQNPSEFFYDGIYVGPRKASA